MRTEATDELVHTAAPLDHGVLNAVRSRVSLELDDALTNPFSTTPGRAETIRAAIASALFDLDIPSAAIDDHIQRLYDELVGLGPLQPFMADVEVSDVLVNRFDDIYIERQGRLERTAARFRDQAHLEQVIAKIVALVGREISVDRPVVDARMVDGSRANAVYAPVGGPTLCIRKFSRLRMDLEPGGTAPRNWVDADGMSAGMAAVLRTLALARATILVAGATGAGKSTLLRSLVNAFPHDERVITIEDTAELELENPHWVKLECVHAHDLAGGDTSKRRLDVADLVQNALRMRPDRLIIGEIRGPREAYHTLEALNTGHDGSATTIHASSAPDALTRLEMLLGRDFGQLAPREIRGYIARVFDVVVFISRLRSGHRCVMEVVELAGLTPDGDYDLRPIFLTEIDHSSSEPRPVFSERFDYEPSVRLARKLALEGKSWT